MSIIILPAVLVLLMLIITGTCWDKEEFCEKAKPNCSDPIVVKTCPERCGECAKGNDNVYMFDNKSWSQIRFQHLHIYKYAKTFFQSAARKRSSNARRVYTPIIASGLATQNFACVESEPNAIPTTALECVWIREDFLFHQIIQQLVTAVCNLNP